MSSSDIAVSVRGLGKSYSIHHSVQKHYTAAEALAATLCSSLKRETREEFWALKDINFDIKQGEVVGIIGRNGAGKSTLLKLLSRITEPTRGEAVLTGRVGSLLEVGTGFHPELTGRENIFLNGAILGMRMREIVHHFNDIVEFAGVEQFLDTPVKRYSSGMYVRLAFAVAAHLNPEILIVDEVLAVGDAEFQKKCLGKMKDVAKDGRTVLFVSHNIAAVSLLCSRGIVLEGGMVAADAPAMEAVSHYQRSGCRQSAYSADLRQAARKGNGDAQFVSLKMEAIDELGESLPAAYTACDLAVELQIEAHRYVSAANVGVTFYDQTGYRVVDVSTAHNGNCVTYEPGGTVTVRFYLSNLLLKPATYIVELWTGRHGIEVTDFIEDAAEIEIMENPAKSSTVVDYPGVYQCRFQCNLGHATTGSLEQRPLVMQRGFDGHDFDDYDKDASTGRSRRLNGEQVTPRQSAPIALGYQSTAGGE